MDQLIYSFQDPVGADLDISIIIPGFKNRIEEFYYYEGSYTQPDCEEGVEWIIYPDKQTAGSSQLRFFSNMLIAEGAGNNRYTQPLGIRTLYKFKNSANHIVAMFGIWLLL